MGLLNRLSLAYYALKGADIGGWNISRWQQGRPYHPDYSHRSLVEKYSSWVYACANKNATNCAQTSLRLYSSKPTKTIKALFPTRKLEPQRLKYLEQSPTCQRYFAKAVEVEEVLQHPFLDLMANVNEFTNGFDLQELTYLCQDLTGNAYWYLSINGTGRPDEIWLLRPQFVKIIPDKQKFILRYEFAVSMDEKYIIDPAKMIHFKHINPKDAFYGLGPLEACVVAADLGMSMNEYETSLMLNRAQPDMALMLPEEAGEPPEEEQGRIQERWRKRFGGTKKAGKLAILTGGAELKPLSLTPKEMNFLMGRKASMNEVAAIFGVPVSKLTTENVNRANAEAGNYDYAKDAILPRLRKNEQKLNERLLPLYDDRLFCAYDNPVPEDKEHRLKEAKSRLSTGQTTINEERQVDGMEEVEWGDVPILPVNMAPLGSVSPATEPTIEPAKAKGVKAPRRLPPLQHPTNFVNEEFVEVMREFFRLQAKEILGFFDRDADSFKRYQPMTKDRASDFVSAWFDMGRWNGELDDKTRPFARFTFTNGGERTLRQLDTQRTFDPLSGRAARAMEQHQAGSARQINNTTFKALRKSMAAGIDEGETAVGLRKRLVEVFGIAERSRAVNIARTETIWAWNEGAVEGYIQSGVVTKKQWVSSGDARSCDFCLDLDGTIVGVDIDYFGKGDTFAVGESELKFDYDDVGHPPLHCMCRCAIVPIIEEF